MAGHSRYHISNKEAGIEKGILKNKLGIKAQKELDEAETLLFTDTYTYFFKLLKEGKLKFDLSLLFDIHKYFFETLYDWAGKRRTVNMSKDNMPFTLVKYIDKALKEFEKILKLNLPKNKDNKNDISKKLAIIHNEFNAIHPFREGNGRTIRLFLDLIIYDLGYDLIDWGKTPIANYFKACIDGMAGNNHRMQKIIKKGFKK